MRTLNGLPRLSLLMLALAAPAWCAPPTSASREIQVMPPWQVFGKAPQRLSGQAFTDEVITLNGATNFSPYLLPAILDALGSRGFTAYPALFSSGLPLSEAFASRKEVAYFVGREPREQSRWFTLVPLVHGMRVARRSLMRESEMEFRFRLELCARAADGSLGDALFDEDFVFPFTARGQSLWEDVDALLPAVAKRLSSSAGWDTVAARIPRLAARFPERYRPEKDTVRERAEDREYLAQSEIHVNIPEHGSRVLKAGFRCAGKDGSSLDDLTFPFQANAVWPEFLYGYILRPDGRVVPVPKSESHVEQSPGALPSKIYDWSRILVVNLPGLEPGSIVTYALRFMDRVPDTTWSAGKGKRYRIPSPLARDMDVLTTHGRAFHAAVWAESGDTVRFAAHQSSLDTVEAVPLRDRTLYIAEGRGIRVPRPGWAGPDGKGFHPVLRFANRKDWQELLMPLRDSAYARIAPVTRAKRLPDRAATDSAILAAHRFIQDSLRYVALAFGDRAYVPAPAETTVARRMGDCKDFTILMISALRQRGVEAVPALVHSEFANHLFPGPPSFNANNHMIVHVPAFGLWVDPTAPVTQPGFLPFNLAGGEALALYPDSIVKRTMPRNDESAYAGSSRFECRISGSDLECERTLRYSQTRSWGIRSWLGAIPEADWPKRLHPGNWDGACRITESGTRVGNFGEQGKGLEVVRAYRAHGAVTKVGGKRVIRVPETPFLQLFRIAWDADTAEALEIAEPVREEITFAIEGTGAVRWPAFQGLDDFGMAIAMTRPSPNSVRFNISLPAGKFEGKERIALFKAVERYKDFFSTLLIDG